MEKPPPRPLPPPNPLTTQRHQRESFQQIFLPFFLAIVLLIVLAILLGRATSYNTSQGAQIALIGLILPTMILGLLFLAVTIAIIVGVAKLTRLLPRYSRAAQDFFALLARQTRRTADSSVEPILRLHQWAAMWQRLRRGHFH